MKYASQFDELDSAVKYIKYELPKLMLQSADLGVDGIEIRDGELYVAGHQINRLSTAERAITTGKIAMAIAKRKGHIAVCLDGAETLDAQHREEFLKAAREAGVCVIYTKVGKPELEFEREMVDGLIQ